MVREILQQVVDILRAENDRYNDAMAVTMEDVLDGDDHQVWEFLTSNYIWGGMGSLLDGATVRDPEARLEFERLIIKLGREQIRQGKVNIRTEMRVQWLENLRREREKRS